MKDKYDKIKLEDINAEKLFEDITDELDITSSHIDILNAITSHDCVTLTLHDAFQKVEKAFDIFMDIKTNKLTKLTNRFQEEEKDV